MKYLPLYLLDLLKSISDMQGVAGMMPLAHMENSKQEVKSMGRQLGGGESKTPEQVGPRPGQLGFSILRRLDRQALDTNLVLSAWDLCTGEGWQVACSGVPVSAAFLFQLNLRLGCRTKAASER